MTKEHLKEKLDYDEELLKDKAKRGAGITALIGTALLTIVNTLSHIVPAVGVLGLSFGGKYPSLYRFVTNEYVQLAYIPFVALSFWYIYRDHEHHKHERELRKQLSEAKEEISRLKKRK